ncbi:MAG: hypothetical protein LBT59_10355 [Clostridiales bacterium]|jgi:hypothetical protein|nr:hypothetical protein [Clostridiales bacterium]
MKRLAIALILLTGLAFGIQQSYSWFSGRDEAPSSVIEAGNLDVTLTSSIGNAAYLSPSLIESGGQFRIEYTITNNSKVPAIVRVNQAGVHLEGDDRTAKDAVNESDKYTFRFYKLTDKCFKLLNHLDHPEKYVDFEYLDSIGFVPFDISSPNYEVVPLVFDRFLSSSKSFITTPDIGLRLNVSFSTKKQKIPSLIAPGYSSRGFSIDEFAPETLPPFNYLYFYLPEPDTSLNINGINCSIEVLYTFSFPNPATSYQTTSSASLQPNDPSVLSALDNTFQYSVITLDITQESLTDEIGNNYLGDLKAVAIENNAGAFRSVFKNYADEPVFYKLQPSATITPPLPTITPLPLPTFAPFNMTVTRNGSSNTNEIISNLGAAPDDYKVIKCTNDKEIIFDIPALERFDVEISSPYCAVDQVQTRISLRPNEDAKAGTVAVIQILLKESNTVMQTIKVVK